MILYSIPVVSVTILLGTSRSVSGKIFKPKQEAKAQVNDDASVETEWDEALAAATEEELVDLAGVCVYMCVHVCTCVYVCVRVCKQHHT